MQAEELVRWIEAAGLGPIAVSLLETTRALGFVAAQALLLGQPLLTGLVEERTLRSLGRWLEDPQQVERLLEQLREGDTEP